MTKTNETLGPCGCTDYHMADCPTRTGGSFETAADIWAAAERAFRRGDYYDDQDW